MVSVEVGLMAKTKLMNNSDMCNHIPACNFTGKWMEFTVPDYSTYYYATRWLREERNFTAIPVDGVIRDGKHTGQFTFRFLCEAEYMLFVLRWS